MAIAALPKALWAARGIQYGVRPLPIAISQKRSDPILKAMS